MTMIHENPSVPTLHNIKSSNIVRKNSNLGGTNKPSTTKTSSSPDIKNASIESLLQTAATVVESQCSQSQILSKNTDEKYPKFEEWEVTAGKVIGRGGFCFVRSVEKLKCNGVSSFQMNAMDDSRKPCTPTTDISSCLPWLCGGLSSSGASEVVDTSTKDHRGSNNSGMFDQDRNNNEDDVEDDYRLTRDYVASTSRQRSNKTKKSPYVIKSVSPNVDKITYMKGCVDIAMECKFLANVDHHNIIRLVAVSASEPCTPSYFLILERMNETLHQRIKSWMDKDRHNKSIFGFVGGKNKELKLYREQIAAAYDISEALYYLHSKNIIYRDLKPDNVGFDIYNVLKLFDFGLAKELRKEDKTSDGLYRNLTKCTGAIRYMAPEVAFGRPYNLTADVYSFGHLLWFVLALEPPYGLYTNKMIFERVMKRGSRPMIFKRWREMITDIMRSCWDADIQSRPSFLEISLCLKQELIDCEGAVEAGGSTVQNNSYHDNDELGLSTGSGHIRRDEDDDEGGEEEDDDDDEEYDAAATEVSSPPSTAELSASSSSSSAKRLAPTSAGHNNGTVSSNAGGAATTTACNDDDINKSQRSCRSSLSSNTGSSSPSKKKRTFLKARRASHTTA